MDAKQNTSAQLPFYIRRPFKNKTAQGPSKSCSRESQDILKILANGSVSPDILQAYKSFCCKVSTVKAKVPVTEPLLYNRNSQVKNKTILHRRWTENGICYISHLSHKHGAFFNPEEFNMKYGLNTDFLTYNSCVPAVKKYIKGLDIDVQSNKPSNMSKSVTIILKYRKDKKLL